MTNDEARAIIRKEYLCVDRDCDIERSCGKCDLMIPSKEPILEAYKIAMQALEQEPREDANANQHNSNALNALEGDAISREAVIDSLYDWSDHSMTDAETWHLRQVIGDIKSLPSVNPQEPKMGYCKNCKFFEYDSVAKVDGIPLIVAHEICSRWGDGCKTKEDGYCFLFEPQESEEV